MILDIHAGYCFCLEAALPEGYLFQIGTQTSSDKQA